MESSGRISLLILILAALSACVCAMAFAESVLTLPAAVSVIEDEAFYGDTSIEEVVLPEGLERIGARAFAGSSLTSINLPDSLASIAVDALPAPGTLTVTASEGSRAYDWAVDHGYIEDSWVSSPLEDFVIRNGVVTKYVGPGGDVVIPRRDQYGNAVTKIGEYAFIECVSLTSISIPKGVTGIKYGAFSGCTGLTRIDLPASLIEIGEYAFNDCTGLKSIVLPDGLKRIHVSAFTDCSGLTSMVLPDGLERIISEGNSFSFSTKALFHGCGRLTSINISGKNTYFSSIDGVLFNKAEDTLICYPRGRTGTYTVPDNVTSIAESAFDGCAGLTGIVFPDGLTGIGESAFSECSALKSVTIPDGVTRIENLAFYVCASLTEIAMPSHLEEIDYYAFGGCTSLTRIAFPESLTYIDEDAFMECENLTTVEAEEGTYAYAWAVKHGYIHPETGFEVFLLPGGYADGDMTEENDVRVWQHLPGCFYSDGGVAEFVVVASGDYTVEYDASYEYIGEEEDYTELEGFIDLYAFDEDGQYYDYTHVNNGDVLSREATSLSCSVYDNRSGAVRETTIKFTCGDKAITYVFSQQPILSSRLIAPADIAQYWESAGDSVLPAYGKSDLALEWASVPGVARYQLCRLIIDEEDNRWGDLYVRIGSPILPTAEDSFTTTLPASFWDEIGEQGEVYIVMLTYDAWGNEYKNHNFGDTQPEYCFRMIQNADTLDYDYVIERDEDTGEATGVSISGYLGDGKDVIIPATLNGLAVTAVADWALSFNENITGVEIPEGVTRIGHLAFWYCTSMTHVTIPNTVTEIESQAFDNCWSLDDIVIPDGVTSIGSSAFADCTSLTHITIPGSVIDIGSCAFEDCGSLESVVIMDGVEWIGDNAFAYCSSLKDIYIPASVVQIEEYGYSYCFSGCDNLTIHGVRGSAAEAYANDYHIPFEPMDV